MTRTFFFDTQMICSKKTYLLWLPVFTLMCLIGLVPKSLAYDNCSIDLSARFTGDDWREAYILKGSDGKVWQRAIVKHPRGKIVLREREEVEITGTAGSNAEVVFFMFAANEDYKTEGLDPPGVTANCFEAGTADDKGFFKNTISPRTLWGSDGGELVVDFFFQTDEGYEQDGGEGTNQNFFIGTGNRVEPLSVEIQVDPTIPGQCPEYCATGNYPGTEIHLLNPDDLRTLAKKYLPAGAENSYINNNFGGITSRIAVLKNAPKNHTFSLGLEDYDFTAANKDKFLSIQQKIVAMEQIKRLFFGEIVGEVDGMPEPLTVKDLKKAADGTDYDRLQTLATAIRDAMTLSGADRRAALDTLTQEFDDMIQQSKYLFTWPPYKIPGKTEFSQMLLTEIKDPNKWADAYIELLDYWTDMLSTNTCLVADDQSYDENFSYYSNFEAREYDFCEYKVRYANGISPRLVLSETIDLVSPKFSQTRITSSDKEFSSGENWMFTDEDDKVIRYAYDDLGIPLGANTVAIACAEQEDSKKLADDIAKLLDLNKSESEELKGELNAALSREEGKKQLSFIDPKEVAKRISWKTNKQPLNVYQLFFRVKPDNCDTYSPPKDLPKISGLRDGFEVGISR